MACYQKIENRLVTCPYDPAHKVKESRLQLHIAKCRTNNLDMLKETCPFNATHVFDPSEKAFHLSNCPDRAPLDRQLANGDLNKNNPFKGCTAVPSYTESIPVECEETWDADLPYEPRAGYKPQSTPSCAIMEPPEMFKPAQRRKFYKELHQINSEPTVPSPSPKAPPQTEPRQPKTSNDGPKFQANECQNVPNLQNLGLGRGKPGRIAANFFSPESHSTTDRSYSAIAHGISQLGLGRGQAANTAYVPNLQDDDFPALGFGRGTSRLPKSGATRAPGVRKLE